MQCPEEHTEHIVALTADSGAARAEIVPLNSPSGTISVLSGLPRFFSKPHIRTLQRCFTVNLFLYAEARGVFSFYCRTY